MFGKFKGYTIRGETVGIIRALAKKRGKGILKIYSDADEVYKNPCGGKKITVKNPMIAMFTIT